LLGGSSSDDPVSIRDIQKREVEVFGSANEESGASSIGVRISCNEEPTIGIYSGDRPRRDTINGKQVIRPTGRDYLYWSMKKTNADPAHQYFPPATNFDLLLTGRPGTEENAFNLAIKALWLMIHLGGVGSRSRRTGGSLSVTEPFKVNDLNFSLTSGKLATRELSDGLKNILRNSSATKRLPQYDILTSGACSVWLIRGEQPWRKWEDAVEEIGQKLCDARTYSSPDKQNVLEWIDGEGIDTVQRSIFGLPLTFKYSNGKSGTIQGKELDRRASPLWLKISKAVNGDYVGVATLFKSAFLPTDEKLYLKSSRSSPPPIDPPPDYRLIENWIKDNLKSEVVYA
jgi:CRISPR-associated protein Cmr1